MNNYNPEAMKKGVIVLLLFLLSPMIRLHAQNPNLEKLNAYKIGFFTKKLNLSSREAEIFWPVYNEYQKQKKGTCFVEVVSNCPSGWKMTPVETIKYLEEQMIPMYPLGDLKVPQN